MANKTINDLTALTGVASADFFPLWDASGAVTRKATLANILAVLLAQANTFTAAQTITLGSSTDALIINMPAGNTAEGIKVNYNGTAVFYVRAQAGNRAVFMNPYDNGASFGTYIYLDRNTNASTPASGFVKFNNKDNAIYNIWPDTAGNLRIWGGGNPVNSNDVAGTVVGTQTSTAHAKNLLGDVGDPREALQAIIDAAKNGLKRFNYKSGSFGGEEFEGVVTDFAPRYGMDRDADHPAGKSLNEIQLFGDLIRAVALLAERIGLIEENSKHG